ncbi:MAG: biotin--[Clostridia bacterium]|nr:biotin--[acetyl-CoA-carboxylase] ligase [Clostridia bacterium]
MKYKYESNGIQRVHFEQLPSTNDYAKEKREEGKPLIVTAARQSKGRGTKGREFVSGLGGVYLSALRFYEEFPAKQGFKIMANAAAAVCNTLRYFGLSPVIKWANDVFVDDKKICGILIENTFSGAFVHSSVVGIGLNVNGGFEGELKEIATSMQERTGKSFSVEQVTEKLIEELLREHDMQEYLSYIGYIGREVLLIFGERECRGRLISVDAEGGLLVELDGEKKRLTSAEVSIRL